jgi:hypothetical protein
MSFGLAFNKQSTRVNTQRDTGWQLPIGEDEHNDQILPEERLVQELSGGYGETIRQIAINRVLQKDELKKQDGKLKDKEDQVNASNLGTWLTRAFARDGVKEPEKKTQSVLTWLFGGQAQTGSGESTSQQTNPDYGDKPNHVQLPVDRNGESQFEIGEKGTGKGNDVRPSMTVKEYRRQNREKAREQTGKEITKIIADADFLLENLKKSFGGDLITNEEMKTLAQQKQFALDTNNGLGDRRSAALSYKTYIRKKNGLEDRVKGRYEAKLINESNAKQSNESNTAGSNESNTTGSLRRKRPLAVMAENGNFH